MRSIEQFVLAVTLMFGTGQILAQRLQPAASEAPSHNVIDRALGAARCDNVTDDSSAFNAALNAARGKALRIPPGLTCLLASPITIPASTTLELDNASLSFAGHTDQAGLIIGGTDIQILGRGSAKIICASVQCIYSAGAVNVDRLIIDGIRVISSPAGAAHCLQLNNKGTANAITVRNSHFDSCRFGILINDAMSEANKLVIAFNRFTSIHADAIELNRPTRGSSDVIIQGNQIALDPVGTTHTGDGFGIGADRVTFMTVANNVVSNTRREAIHVEGEGAKGNDHITLSGNVMKCEMDCIHVLGPGSLVTIQGNVLRGEGNRGFHGIHFPDTALVTQRVVSGNIIDSFTQGITTGSARGISIINGNYIQNAVECIHLDAALGDQIQGNVLENCRIGIFLRRGGIVGRNTFDRVDNPATAANGKVLLRALVIRRSEVALRSGDSTNISVMPLGTRLEGSVRLIATGGGANWFMRASSVKWDGSSFTESNQSSISGGGALSNGALQRGLRDVQARIFSGTTTNADITLEFDGDLMLP